MIKLQRYKVLKDIYVNAGPPFILLKSSEVILYKSKTVQHPVLSSVFEDRETHDAITSKNWTQYFEPVK